MIFLAPISFSGSDRPWSWVPGHSRELASARGEQSSRCLLGALADMHLAPLPVNIHDHDAPPFDFPCIEHRWTEGHEESYDHCQREGLSTFFSTGLGPIVAAWYG